MKKISKYIPEIIGLIIFLVITFIGAVHHEMWFDEAEAWVIARDNGIIEIFDILKSEGHPFLWYLILKLFTCIGFSADLMPLISWFFTSITVGIILLKSPFSRVLKFFVVFSSGFLYFNNIISRVYCIILLLLSLIAVIFPKRKDLPILYGILIALMTNTHICICGVIFVLGINMIIELIQDWKTDNATKRTKKITGLVISAGGVILLFITLLGALNSNSELTVDTKTWIDIMRDIPLVFYDIPVMASFSGDYIILPELLCMFFCGCMILILILLRYDRISLYTLFFFLFFYSIVCGVIWYTNPNRACIVYYVILFSYWIYKNNYHKSEYNAEKYKVDSKAIKYIIKIFSLMNNNSSVILGKIIAVLFGLTIPVGFNYLISDYYRDFSPERKATDYIKDNYDKETTVIVTATDGYPQLSCYLPEYTLYSAYIGDEYTYHDHNINYQDMVEMYNPEKVEEYLIKWDEIIYIETDKYQKEELKYIHKKNIPGTVVYSVTNSMRYGTKHINLYIREVTVDEVVLLLNN